jgi:hypothetical protein
VREPAKPTELAVDHAVNEKRRRWSRLVAGAKPYSDVVDAILKTLLVVTVFLGAFEYFSRQQATRVEKSLEVVDEWQTAGHREAWQRINNQLWPLYAPNADAIAALGDDPAQRALLYANLGDAVTGRDDAFLSPADQDVDAVFYFFERAALCSNERICDYDVIATFLGDEARTFWLYFSRYAERRQAVGYVGYGAWTERFAEGNVRRSLWGLI